MQTTIRLLKYANIFCKYITQAQAAFVNIYKNTYAISFHLSRDEKQRSKTRNEKDCAPRLRGGCINLPGKLDHIFYGK